MLVEGLYKLLSTDSGIIALLGNARGDQTTGIFPVVAPKEVTVPYIVYEQASNNISMSMSGINRTQEGRFRFHCFAADYPTARKVAQAIKKTLGGLVGTLTDVDATPVQDATPNFEGDGPIDGELRNTIYHHIIDFDIWYVDTTN